MQLTEKRKEETLISALRIVGRGGFSNRDVDMVCGAANIKRSETLRLDSILHMDAARQVLTDAVLKKGAFKEQ